ncbi:MAG: hypothetical protein AB1798_22930, partial [Spirochaetota bacterium]
MLPGIALVLYTYYNYFLEEYLTGWQELQSYLSGMTSALTGRGHGGYWGAFPDNIVSLIKNYFTFMHPAFGIFAVVFLIWSFVIVVQNSGKNGDRDIVKLWFPWLAVQFWGFSLLFFKNDGYRYLFV